MKPKILIALAIALGASGIGLIHTLSKARFQKVPKDNQIQWHIQEAKKLGLKQVTIQAPTSDYLGAADQDIYKALAEYTVIVAEPIDARSYEHTPNMLITWNKFRTTEMLTELRPPLCSGCSSLLAPADMLPLNSGEFLVPRAGGTIIRDGIELTEAEPSFPPFRLGQKYLMLLQLYPSGIALTAGGPVGVFRLDRNEKLLPLNNEPHPLKDGIQQNLGSSLGRLREKINSS